MTTDNATWFETEDLPEVERARYRDYQQFSMDDLAKQIDECMREKELDGFFACNIDLTSRRELEVLLYCVESV